MTTPWWVWLAGLVTSCAALMALALLSLLVYAALDEVGAPEHKAVGRVVSVEYSGPRLMSVGGKFPIYVTSPEAWITVFEVDGKQITGQLGRPLKPGENQAVRYTIGRLTKKKHLRGIDP